jgi:hypothetical protein
MTVNISTPLNTPIGIKTSDQIINELSAISPLALPQALIEYEIADMKSSQKLLDEIAKEFEDKGGVAGQLVETVLGSTVEGAVNGCVKKWGSDKLKSELRKKNVNIVSIVKQCLNFKYPDSHLGYCTIDQKQFTAGMREYTYVKSPGATDITRQEYEREKLQAEKWNEFRDKKWAETYGDVAYGNDEYGGSTQIRVKHNKAENDNRIKDKYGHQAELDHIIPLKQIHGHFNQFSEFTERYLTDGACVDIANDDTNLAFTNKRLNRWIKNSRTNEEAIAHSEKICQEIKDKLSEPGITEEQREKLKKKLNNWSLSDEEKQILRDKQEQAEKSLKINTALSGAKTVGLEQIGKIVETVVGPISFELKDMVKNGVTSGVEAEDFLSAIGLRLKRAFIYIASELPRLLGELFKDIGQMLLTFLKGFICKIGKLLKGFIDIITKGFGSIIEAIKILQRPDSQMSGAQKGHAITKLLISFAAGALGGWLIDLGLEQLGLPDPFSDILASIASAIITSLLMYIFDKIDIFSTKSELRLARVKEVFDLRIQVIKESTNQFDIAARETMKAQRIQFEKLKITLDGALRFKNMKQVNAVMDDLAEFFKVDIPYSSPEEFLRFIQSNEKMVIGG